MPKKRARTVLSKTGRVSTYTPKETVDYEQRVGWSWRAPKGYEGAVAITVKVYEGETPHPADLDNYLKSALDGLNHVAYADDKQVVDIQASIERHCADPRMVVTVYALEAAESPQDAPAGTSA